MGFSLTAENAESAAKKEIVYAHPISICTTVGLQGALANQDLRFALTRPDAPGLLSVSWRWELGHLFFSVRPTPLRIIVSRLGFVVIASIYLGSAICGLILWAMMRPPGRTSGSSFVR